MGAHPGATVGWGFTIANDTGYLVVTGSNYITNTPVGAYSDFAGTYNFLVIGPAPESASITQSFDALLHTGLGSYTIAPDAIVGARSNGTLQLSYDLYLVSPNDESFDPGIDYIGSGTLQSDASVTPTPEPSTSLLLGAGVFALARLRRILARSSSSFQFR